MYYSYCSSLVYYKQQGVGGVLATRTGSG